MKLWDWTSDTIVSWFIKDWATRNLTVDNLKSGVKGLGGWLADPLIRDALMRVVKFCLSEIINEIKQHAKNNTD